MKCKYSITIWLFLAVLFLVACDNGERQRLQLAELERQNRADSLMLNDSLARDLADWFDRHGTPNEQMRAHYILGRTYADRGESPAALDAYQNAVNCADTASQDCDYYTLCRVYSQMGAIFYTQGLFEHYLVSLNQSIAFAEKANDSIVALNSYAHKALAYNKLHLSDSVIKVCENTYHAFVKMGFPQQGSRYLSLAIEEYTETGNLIKAKAYMDIYEHKSGYFDSKGNIEKGREAYYQIKGRYYLKAGNIDSARYFFHRELEQGRDYNNQNMSAHALAVLYHHKNYLDSAIHYALFAYDMNDSIYEKRSMETIAQMQAAFNYSRHQLIAKQEKERANREKFRLHILLFLFLIVLIVGFCIGLYVRQKRIKERAKYKEIVTELTQTQNDVLRLRSHEDELGDLLHEKEKKVQELLEELIQYKENRVTYNGQKEELVLSESLVKMSNKGTQLTSVEWNDLDNLIIEKIPEFYRLITSPQYSLSISEYRVAILLRLQIKPKVISNLLGCTPQYVTKLSKILLGKLFGETGRSRDLMEKLTEIC